MAGINLNASRLQEMVKAAEKYAAEKNVSFRKVYLRIDTGINAGSYVISDEEWDEREMRGTHRAPPAIPSPEDFPHGGGRLGRSAQLAEQIGFYPKGPPKPSETGKPVPSPKHPVPHRRQGEPILDYQKRRGLS